MHNCLVQVTHSSGLCLYVCPQTMSPGGQAVTLGRTMASLSPSMYTGQYGLSFPADYFLADPSFVLSRGSGNRFRAVLPCEAEAKL